MTTPTTTLERLAKAIYDASKKRWFCLYDYSAYPEQPGGLKPYVVRDESNERVVFESDNHREAREVYEAKERQAVAKAALEAIREPSVQLAGDVFFYATSTDQAAEHQKRFTAMIDAILTEKEPE